MPGRVQSDHLFGGEVVGLRVRIKAVLIYMECFDFFKEVSCLCGLPWWLSGKKKKKKKICLPRQEMWVQSPGREDSLETEIATHSVFLPGKSHGQRSLEGGSPLGQKRVRHDLATK